MEKREITIKIEIGVGLAITIILVVGMIWGLVT